MKKRRILLALIMLIISGVSLTTATYAWFTANQAVSVEKLDVKANASGGIQISADAKSWSNQVTLDQLKAEKTNFFNTVLMPVTTIGTNTQTGKFDFYLGTLDDSGQKVSLKQVQDSGNNYLAFDLYFYMAKPETILFNDGTQVIAKNTGNDKKLKYSARVGFLVQGNDDTATPETAKGLAEGTLAEQIIWEPNADQHTPYAVAQSGAVNGEVKAYMGGKAAAESPVVLTDGSKFETVAGTHHLVTSTEAELYPKSTQWSFKAGITKVRIYVWLEGQDVDNEDTASLGEGISVTLNFKKQAA